MVMYLQFLDQSNDYQVFKDGWSGWVPEAWLSSIPSAGRNQATGRSVQLAAIGRVAWLQGRGPGSHG